MPRNDQEYSRTFVSILYPDDPSQAYAIEVLKNGVYNAAGILHLHCVNEAGEPKKPHYHFVIRFDNPKGIKTLAKELHIDENYLKVSSSKKKALLYLIHRGWPDKYQYPVDEVFGTLKKELLSYLDDSTEDERILQILHLLDEFDDVITMREFIQLIANEGLYADLRRSGYLFAAVLREHNEKYLR